MTLYNYDDKYDVIVVWWLMTTLWLWWRIWRHCSVATYDNIMIMMTYAIIVVWW